MITVTKAHGRWVLQQAGSSSRTAVDSVLNLRRLLYTQAGNKSMLAYRSDIGIPGYTGKCCLNLSHSMLQD